MPSRQKIAAVLRKAGFVASKSRTSRIRGWKNYTVGFAILRKTDDALEVYYRTDYCFNEAKSIEWAQKYAVVLEPLGGKMIHDKIVFRP